MTYTEVIQNLKEKYCNERNISLTNDEFSLMLITYPGFLVGNADGNFDQDEQELVIGLVLGLAEAKKGSELTGQETQQIESLYLNEFNYLANEGKKWEPDFLELLTIFNSDGWEQVKNAIQKIMKDVAEVTDSVSKKEQEIIDYINENCLSSTN